MKTLDRRGENTEAILKGRFVEEQLREEATDIKAAQTSLMSRRGFRSADWYDKRTFTISGNQMDYDHMPRHRFVDMKTRNTKSQGKIRKKSHPNHNRIFYGHANNLIKRLHFGYTEAVKEQLSRDLDE
ncbi:hypothetical protein VS868_12025 [Salinimicrobium sp. 3283s]|uniref:hypothetical protein n=1 Tax=Salinimicrobium sp. 3283s TaxID=3114359 RepID=UPI0031EFDB77